VAKGAKIATPLLVPSFHRCFRFAAALQQVTDPSGHMVSPRNLPDLKMVGLPVMVELIKRQHCPSRRKCYFE
jgi:hypothetical protein